MVLCNASYYGTVAAIRSLGRAGIPVVAVDTGLLAPGDAPAMLATLRQQRREGNTDRFRRYEPRQYLRQVVQAFRLEKRFTKRLPEMAIPMLQRYYPELAKKIYSVPACYAASVFR